MLPPSKKHPLGCHNPRVEVDGANRHDVKLARPTAENIQIKKPRVTKKRKQHLCLEYISLALNQASSSHFLGLLNFHDF